MAPTYRWDPYGHFGVWKRWGNKTYQSTSKSQSWVSWFVKKWKVWWCGIGSNIFLKTGMTVVCLSLPAWHGSEYHYNKGKNNFTKSAIPHHHGLFKSQGNLRMSRDQFWSLLILRRKSAENYPSRKLEYLSHQPCYIASQGGKWKIFAIRIFFIKYISNNRPLVMG
mgnify:CR=1 FL=1